LFLHYRTAFEKKRKAVEFCGNATSKLFSDSEQGVLPSSPKVMKTGPAGRLYNDNCPHTHSLSIGDIVAVPFENDDNMSTFWLGKCLRLLTESTVLLGWLKQTEHNDERYKLEIGSSWEEVRIVYIVSV
jgi:hypothetical protein